MTFPSVYSFFPLNGHGLLNERGQVIRMDFFNVDDWTREKFKLAQTATMREFLPWMLSQAKKFREQVLNYKVGVDYPKILIVRSSNFLTLSQAQKKSTDGGWDFSKRIKEPGDERVLAIDAVPYGMNRPPFEVFETSMDHAHLLNDPLVIQRVKKFINGEN